MRKPLNLMIAVLALFVLSSTSAFADNHRGWDSNGFFNLWGSGFHGWGNHWFRGHNKRGNRRSNGWGWGRNDNNGNNGCKRSNYRSRSCEQNPNTDTTFYCIIWTDTEVRHPETFESAYSSSIWQLGDIALFDSGETCVVNDEPPPPPPRG